MHRPGLLAVVLAVVLTESSIPAASKSHPPWHPQAAAAVCVIDGKIVVVGGKNRDLPFEGQSGVTIAGQGKLTHLKSVECYDPATNVSPFPSYPALARSLARSFPPSLAMCARQQRLQRRAPQWHVGSVHEHALPAGTFRASIPELLQYTLGDLPK